MRTWDANGNVIEVPNPIVNNLETAPIFDQLPPGALFVPIIVAAPNGMMRLGRVPPALLRMQRTGATLAANGSAQIMFNRSFVNEPVLSFSVGPDDGDPILVQVTSWVRETPNAGAYTGANLRGYRLQKAQTLIAAQP